MCEDAAGRECQGKENSKHKNSGEKMGFVNGISARSQYMSYNIVLLCVTDIQITVALTHKISFYSFVLVCKLRIQSYRSSFPPHFSSK